MEFDILLFQHSIKILFKNFLDKRYYCQLMESNIKIIFSVKYLAGISQRCFSSNSYQNFKLKLTTKFVMIKLYMIIHI